MKECSKSIYRRLSNPNFINKYFVGNGIDIGGKPDPLNLYSELFSKVISIKTWDKEDGDGQFLSNLEEGQFDFLHSSHCLEHLEDPQIALQNWIRVIKPGGHIIFTVPDEDLYEQGVFPSTYNKDHKWTFTIHKKNSWSPKSINLFGLITKFSDQTEIIKIEFLDSTFRYNLPRFDQTLTPVGECGIEVVLRKRFSSEIKNGGKIPLTNETTHEIRIHLNQYRDDLDNLKKGNIKNPPFNNDSELN